MSQFHLLLGLLNIILLDNEMPTTKITSPTLVVADQTQIACSHNAITLFVNAQPIISENDYTPNIFVHEIADKLGASLGCSPYIVKVDPNKFASHVDEEAFSNEPGDVDTILDGYSEDQLIEFISTLG